VDEPIWVSRTIVDAVHTNQLHEHGGLQGTRDINALEAALARPQQKYAYKPDCDLAELAAAYVYGLATVHPYADSNKRSAFVVSVIFLELNGFDLDRSDKDIVDTMCAVGAGEVSEAKLAAWIRAALVAL
jgi:death-on-curing protein